MTPDQALQEASTGNLRPVYLLVGEERHLESEVLKALREATLAGGVPGLNEDQFQAGESTVDHVLAAARTLPMMAKRRLVVARGLERWEGRDGKEPAAGRDAKHDPFERLLEYAKSPASTTTLLLVGSGLDKRRRIVNTARNEGWLVACEPLARADLPQWIVRRVQARGNRIDASTADLIAELVGPDLAPVADAVERLCLYAGEGQPITEEAVSECVVKLRPGTVWELLGAIGRRDRGAALRALAEVFEPHEGPRLIGLIAWSTRQLLRFESAMREGLPPPEAAKRAGAPPFKARELAQQVKGLPAGELERWLVTLSELDLNLKGGSKRPAQAVLEAGILELCRAPERRGAARPSPPKA